MSDWQVGDLAVCVDASNDRHGAPVDLVDGRTYRVTAIMGGLHKSKFGYTRGLHVAGAIPNGLAFAMDRFRKIRPDEHEACEPEFVTLLKRTKHKVQA